MWHRDVGGVRTPTCESAIGHGSVWASPVLVIGVFGYMALRRTRVEVEDQLASGDRPCDCVSSDEVAASERCGHVSRFAAAVFKLRGLLMVPVVAFAFLYTGWEWEYEPGVLSLGLLLFAAGLCIRCWSQRHLKYRVRSEGARGLATTGPFACCRNPVYIGNVLLLAGLVMLCELAWAVPLVVCWGALVYTLAVRYEEFRLTKRFGGEYSCYRSRVRRWLPAVPGLRMVESAASPASWSRVLGAEWQCAVLLAIPAVKEILVESSLHHLGSVWLISIGS